MAAEKPDRLFHRQVTQRRSGALRQR